MQRSRVARLPAARWAWAKAELNCYTEQVVMEKQGAEKAPCTVSTCVLEASRRLLSSSCPKMSWCTRTFDFYSPSNCVIFMRLCSISELWLPPHCNDVNGCILLLQEVQTGLCIQKLIKCFRIGRLDCAEAAQKIVLRCAFCKRCLTRPLSTTVVQVGGEEGRGVQAAVLTHFNI